MQDLDKFKNEMNLSGQNVYVGHRYVPKIFGEWSNDNSYEGLSIVTYQGASYTSRQFVPVGIEITNEEFWVITGNYDAQVENYRQHVVTLQNSIKGKAENSDLINLKNETIQSLNELAYNVLDFDVKNDGTDTETELNALPEGYTYYFPDGEYGVKGYTDVATEAGLKLKDNTTYIFSPNAKIKVLKNANERYAGILINGANNFKLINPQVIGEREIHDYSSGGTHERGAGIMIRGAAVGEIIQPVIKDTTGDGIDIICTVGSDLLIEKPFIRNVRRNGISIESVDKLVVNEPDIENVNGTAPEAGIDIEPFLESHILNNVKINRGVLKNNAENGILFAGYIPENANIDIYDIETDDIHFNSTDTGVRSHVINIHNPKITGGKRGLIFKNAYYNVNIYNPIIMLDKVDTDYPTPIYFQRNTGTGYQMGGVKVYKAILKNPKNIYKRAVIFSTSSDTSDPYYRAMKDIYIDITENEFKGTGYDTLGVYQVIFENTTLKNIPNSNVNLTTALTPHTDFYFGRTITNTGATAGIQHTVTNATADRLVGTQIKFKVTTAQNLAVYCPNNFLPSGMKTYTSNTLGSELTVEVQKFGDTNRYVVVNEIGTWTKS